MFLPIFVSYLFEDLLFFVYINVKFCIRIECVRLMLKKEKPFEDDEDHDDLNGRMVSAGKDGRLKVWSVTRFARNIAFLLYLMVMIIIIITVKNNLLEISFPISL